MKIKSQKQSNIIGLKALRENIGMYITRVQRGDSLIVMRRSEPLFKLTPLSSDEGEWEAIIDFTKVKKGGISISELLSRI